MVALKSKKPEWMSNFNPESELFLDLRRYLRNGLEPLPAILDLLRESRPCQILHLAGSQDPVTLYEILEPMGFEHYTEHRGKRWDAYFRKCG
jgi:hypothetical protein